MALFDALCDLQNPASEQELDVVRALVPALPGELEAYLRITNGANVKQTNFAALTPWGGRHITLDQFWPATRQRPAGSSIETCTNYLRREWMLPQTVLVIAGDVESNSICMSCEPGSFGVIYLWDDTRSYPNEASKPIGTLSEVLDYMAPIAASLDAFAAMLTDEDTARAQAAAANQTGA